MPKERSINPAQAQRKAEKAKLIKRGKAEAAARRTEKLARRDPARLQKQLDDLLAIESSGGKLTSHEQKVKDELERDLKAVRKARETLGDKAPSFGSFGRRDGASPREGGVLGKRRRNGMFCDNESDESDVPVDVREIPMPRDTPPPIPREIMNRWYQSRREGQDKPNNLQLDAKDDDSKAPQFESKTVYEAAPVIRNLRKEAVNAFVPSAVRLKLEKSKGVGGLVEPEEADALEKQGYMGASLDQASGDLPAQNPHSVTMEEVADEGD